jgi:hypothetical protein
VTSSLRLPTPSSLRLSGAPVRSGQAQELMPCPSTKTSFSFLVSSFSKRQKLTTDYGSNGFARIRRIHRWEFPRLRSGFRQRVPTPKRFACWGPRLRDARRTAQLRLRCAALRMTTQPRAAVPQEQIPAVNVDSRWRRYYDGGAVGFSTSLLVFRDRLPRLVFVSPILIYLSCNASG